MNKVGNVAGFTAVDSATDALFYVDFMDRANALPEYPGIRSGLVDAMGPLAGKRVLEIGCGAGDDARELSRIVGPRGHVIGVDFSEAMVEAARRRSLGFPGSVEFVQGDARKLEVADNSVDAVYAKLILMHCADIEAAIDELVRITRPGGRIAAYDIDFDTVIVEHPDRHVTRTALTCFSDSIRNGWSGRQLKRRFLARGMRNATVAAHAVVTPFEIFYSMLAGPLAGAQADGRLALSAAQLEAWWEPLFEADAAGRFFSSFTGFVVGATVS
jgi:ubiquinone/menaquinone biosynthesis C-methylase UbiE